MSAAQSAFVAALVGVGLVLAIEHGERIGWRRGYDAARAEARTLEVIAENERRNARGARKGKVRR